MYLDRRSDDFLVLRFSYSCNIALWGTLFPRNTRGIIRFGKIQNRILGV